MRTRIDVREMHDRRMARDAANEAEILLAYVLVAVHVGGDGEADGEAAGGGEPRGAREVDGGREPRGGGLGAGAGGDAVGARGGELAEHGQAVAADAVGRHPGRARQVGRAGRHELRHLRALQRRGGRGRRRRQSRRHQQQQRRREGWSSSGAAHFCPPYIYVAWTYDDRRPG
jgi:hypothetical protein